jgi:hypothetical protein
MEPAKQLTPKPTTLPRRALTSAEFSYDNIMDL